MSYNHKSLRAPANPKWHVGIVDEPVGYQYPRSTAAHDQQDDDKYIILESQIFDTNTTKTYKCQMNDKAEQIGFVKLYNKHLIESEENGFVRIQRIQHSINVLQTFSDQSANWMPKLISKVEDEDSIEVITEFVQDNIGDMIEQKQIFCENDAIFLMKCILMNLYEMHNIKNVFNAKECYLNLGIHPRSLLFQSSMGLLDDDKKESVLFSNTGDLYQEEDLKKKSTKELEYLIRINDYISPETLKHKRITMQSNLWSVGCIFYEMLFKEKFIEIDAQQVRSKEGLTEFYQQMKYSSETLRSSLICKSTNISTFSITCLQGLLAFHEKDRFTWESVKKNIFSLDLTKSIDDYDLRSIHHSYVSNNSQWATRSRTGFGTSSQATYSARKGIMDTSNVYMSFSENSVILEQGREENNKSLIAKSMNKSQMKYSFSNNNNNNFLQVSNINRLNPNAAGAEEDNFLKESYMNGIMKKSLINGNPSNENSQILYMQKSQNNEIKNSNMNGNQVINMLQSFSMNGFQNKNIGENHQLNQNSSFTDDIFMDDNEREEDNQQMTYEGATSHSKIKTDKSITKSGNNKSNLLGKSDFNKTNLSYTNSNNVVSYNITNKTNNNDNHQQNTHNTSQLDKSNASDRSHIYKYQLQMPNYQEMQKEIKQNKHLATSTNQVDKLENNSHLSDNKSLFKHIEQYKQNREQQFCPLLDQYDSSQKSEDNSNEKSRNYSGFDFLDQLMAQKGSFNPEVDLHSNRSDVSSNASNVKQIPPANPKNQIQQTKNTTNNIANTQKIQIKNDQALSIHDLSNSPYNTNTMKYKQNGEVANSNNLDTSYKTLQMQKPNGEKTKKVSESHLNDDLSMTKSKNNNIPQIVYSVVPTPTQSQINHYQSAAGNNGLLQQPSDRSTNREGGGGMLAVCSQYINASDLKSRLNQIERNDQSGNYFFDEEPIVGMDQSSASHQAPQTPQQRYMVFDELVSQDELACSYMLNTKMRNKLGIDINHLHRAFSEDPQYQAFGEVQQEVQGNQSFTSAVGYEKSVYYDKKNQVIVQKERKSSLIHSQTIKTVNPPVDTLKDLILKEQYKPFSQNDELFVFSSFLDPFEFKIQGYFQTVLQKTEEIFKHFNNEECLNCVIVVLSLFRVRLYHLIFRQLTEQAKKSNEADKKSSKRGGETEKDEYFSLTQSIKQEMKEKVTQDKNIKCLDELILQFLKRSTLEKGKDLIEPQIYLIFRKHLFNFYNFLGKKIYDSQAESKKELKLPYDRLVQMSRLGYHILILSHYQKVFKLYFKELFTDKQNSNVSNLFEYIEEKISYMDLYQLQNEKNKLKTFLNLKEKQQQPPALPRSTSPFQQLQNKKSGSNQQNLSLLPPQPYNKMEQLNKQSILI